MNKQILSLSPLKSTRLYINSLTMIFTKFHAKFILTHAKLTMIDQSALERSHFWKCAVVQNKLTLRLWSSFESHRFAKRSSSDIRSPWCVFATSLPCAQLSNARWRSGLTCASKRQCATRCGSAPRGVVISGCVCLVTTYAFTHKYNTARSPNHCDSRGFQFIHI